MERVTNPGLVLLSLLLLSGGCASAGASDSAPPSAPAPAPAAAPAARPVAADSDAEWQASPLRRQILEGLVAESDVEPKVTVAERDALQKVFDLMATDQLDAAADAVAKLRGPAASAVVDYTFASLCFQREKLAEAAEGYREAVAKFPRFLRAWRFLGRVHLRDGDFRAAAPALTKVIELGGADALAWGLLAYARANLDDPVAAESAYRMAVLLDPASDDWKLGLARSFWKQRRFADAIALFDTMLAARPERTDLWLLQADCWLGLEQPQRAAQNFEIVARLGKATSASMLTLGDIYVNEGDYDLAVGAYGRAFALDPRLDVTRPLRAARVLAVRGAHEQAGVLVAAIESAAGAELGDEPRKEILRLRARLAAATGATEEEARVLEEVVRLDPLDGDALLLLGDHSKRGGDLDRAVFWYERAESLEAFEADARLRHGQLLVTQGRYVEALPLLRRAQLLKPREKLEEHIAQVERAAAQSRG